MSAPEGVSSARHASGGDEEAMEGPASLDPSGDRWRNGLKWTISLAILIALTLLVDWSEVGRIARAAEPRLLLLALSFLLLGNLVIAWRWQLLLGMVGIPIRIRQVFRSYLKGHFAGHVIPFGMTADIIKTLDMHRTQVRANQARPIELVSTLLMERVFGAISVAIAVCAGLTLSPLVSQHADTQQALYTTSFVVMVCCALALYLDRWLALVPHGLFRRFPRMAMWVTRAQASFAAYRRRPARLVGLVVLSLGIQALRVLPVYAVAFAIGAGGAIYPFLIAVPVIYLSNALPGIGGRIGAEQGLFVLFLGLAGIAPESALLIALISLGLGATASLPGAYWLLKDHTSLLSTR